MSTTTKLSAALRREQDARPLMLHCARVVLHGLAITDRERERMGSQWDDADAPVDMAVDLACDTLRRLIEEAPERKAFELQWWRISGVVTLAARAFTAKGTAYARLLAGVDTQLQVLPELWQTVAEGWPLLEGSP